MNLRARCEALERAALGAALDAAGGNAAAAARLLGEVGRGAARDPGGTVRAMMRRLGHVNRGCGAANLKDWPYRWTIVIRSDRP